MLCQIELYFDTIQGVHNWRGQVDTAEATARQAVHLLLVPDEGEAAEDELPSRSQTMSTPIFSRGP